jgi:protein phosphatase
VERLVQLALRGGGPDNITVVIADATDHDILEAAPIVGGAAARDRGMATSADGSTPAARASALSAPRPASPEQGAAQANPDDDGERPRRHPIRTALILLVLVGVLGGGLWLGWSVTQRQYYVGATQAGQLAVFKGVPGQIAGLALSSVHSTSNTAQLSDLTAPAQEQVKQGIQAKDEPDAKRLLAQLTNDVPGNPNLKPTCPPSLTPGAGQSVGPQTPAPKAMVSPTPRTTPTAGRSVVATPAGTPDSSLPETIPPVINPAGCRSTQ